MRVLVVEDDPNLSFLWVEALSEVGFDVTAVANCTQATKSVLRAPFDLFILDMFVEDGHTIGLSDWIKLRCADSRIVMLTGSGMFANGDHGDVASNVDWLLRKPTQPSELVAIAEHLTKDAKAHSAMPFDDRRQAMGL